MNNYPKIGTKIKLVGDVTQSFYNYFNNFSELNEWEVIGISDKKNKATGENLVLIKNCCGIYSNITMQFFKKDMEEL